MNFKRRHFSIRTTHNSDIENYYYEFSQLSITERAEKIKRAQEELTKMDEGINSQGMLSVLENDTNKLLGIIRFERKKGILGIRVLIPNESKLYRYGFEIVDQFLKISREQWSDEIKFVRLNEEDEAAKMYLKERDLQSEYICIA